MRRDRFRNNVEDYRKCAREGMTVTQTANYLGVCGSTVSLAASRNNIKFATRAIKSPMAPKGLKTGLTEAQKIDVKTLVTKGGYTEEDAISLVMAPKVKIRLGKPPGPPHGDQEPMP